MSQKKMILILDDKAVEAMLLAASSGGDPTRVLGQLIEDFRLSMLTDVPTTAWNATARSAPRFRRGVLRLKKGSPGAKVLT
jgi:hypothetical protein